MSPQLTTTTDGVVYEVFAKAKKSEPLHHVGSVIADDAELASMYAQTLYNEWNWNEMILVPRDKIIHILEPA